MSVKKALERLRDAIKNINVYKSPWDNIKSNTLIEDPFGSITFNNNNNLSAFVLKSEYVASVNRTIHYENKRLQALGAGYGTYVNFRITSDGKPIEKLDHTGFTSYGVTGYRYLAFSPFTLIMPDSFDYHIGTIYGYNSYNHVFERGLYLSKTYINNNNPYWISTDMNRYVAVVKCPVGASVPYYLNKLNISADDMVGIFENMIDRSSESGVKYITLGSTNLSKLTQDQKNIAINKGWSLQ